MPLPLETFEKRSLLPDSGVRLKFYRKQIISGDFRRNGIDLPDVSVPATPVSFQGAWEKNYPCRQAIQPLDASTS